MESTTMEKALDPDLDASEAPSAESALKLATAGDREAQFGLGLKFRTGTGRDYAQAAEWYQKAAAQSHGMAQFNLGVMYAEGHGVDRDFAQSKTWFGRAAGQGDAGAQHHLGLNYQRACHEIAASQAGELRIEAYKWFSLAAAQGYQGSALACDQVNMGMSRDEVAEANRRLALGTPELKHS
jgi:TPR repeat protein